MKPLFVSDADRGEYEREKASRERRQAGRDEILEALKPFAEHSFARMAPPIYESDFARARSVYLKLGGKL